MARKKIQSKWVGKAEQSSKYFLLKMYKWSSPHNFFLDSEIDITKRDMLRYIKINIFNPSIRYPKYLKMSLTDYKERIDNCTKYLEIKI